MLQKLTAVLAALAFALTTFTPAIAEARDRRDGYYDRGYRDYDHRRRNYSGRRHGGDDAAVAGVVGLVLGVALGAALSQPRQAPRQAQCYDNYQRCGGPPPGYYDQGYYPDDSRLEGGYDPRYDDRRYGDRRRVQICQLREWDSYSERYVIVEVPC